MKISELIKHKRKQTNASDTTYSPEVERALAAARTRPQFSPDAQREIDRLRAGLAEDEKMTDAERSVCQTLRIDPVEYRRHRAAMKG